MASVRSAKITGINTSTKTYQVEARIISPIDLADPLAYVDSIAVQKEILSRAGISPALALASSEIEKSGKIDFKFFWDLGLVFAPSVTAASSSSSISTSNAPVTIKGNGKGDDIFVVKDGGTSTAYYLKISADGDLVIGKNLRWSKDGSYDRGASNGNPSWRPRNIYTSNDVYADGDVLADRSLVNISQANQHQFNQQAAAPSDNSTVRYLYWNSTDNTLRFWDGATEKIIDEAGTGNDPDAIHDNVSGEIAALTEKTTPLAADLILIEDSATANTKKKVQIGNLPGGGGNPWIENEFSPSNGQISFILSQAPADINSFTLLVNGVLADDGTDYTVSGTTLTWLNNLFVLDTGDKLLARYV